MITQEEFRDALEKTIRAAGSQTALAEKVGMTQSQISDYMRGRFQIENMTIGNLYKLFPDMVVDFFGGSTGNVSCDALRSQLLEIFDDLNERDKVRMVTMAAANFGETIRAKTLSDPNRKRNRHD